MENVYDKLKKHLNTKLWNATHYDKSTPKMELPDFYGNYNLWMSFKDLFTETIHSNPLLSKSQKMQYLKTKLKGEAGGLIQHLHISAENYDAAWAIINHRYDNQKSLFTSLMNTLLNQPVLQQATAQNMKKMHDVTVECLNGLNNIGLDLTTWDPIIVHLLAQKLDSDTHEDYTKGLKKPRGLPDLEEFFKFLENKFIQLESRRSGQNQKQVTSSQTANNNHKNYNTPRSTHFNKHEKASKVYFTTAKTCPMCNSDHVLMQCSKFLSLSTDARNDTVTKLNLCKNCLFTHGKQPCTSTKKCKVCYKAHHTLLHKEMASSSGTHPNQSSNSTERAVNNVTNEEKEVLLTTVQLQVKSLDGSYVTLRALLDQGSQVSIITEDAAQRLRLPRRKLSAVVSGVGALSGNCKGSLNLECKSIHSNYKFEVETLIMKKLINNLPSKSFSKQNWDYLDNLKLADPNFNVSGTIDILLGADVYSELILDGVLKGVNGSPVAQQTRVGWILCGHVKTFNCFVTLNELENITKFWETEEIGDSSQNTEEEHCENYYKQTTERQEDGKYVVKMPMKPNFEENLGKTRPQALAQFYQLERKMNRNENFSKQYKNFIKEYVEMGHMKPVTPMSAKTKQEVFLPHHGVIREESTTTKLRVVFNASMPTDSKYSLNDLMYTGPNLQKDMLTLIINWRVHRYVLTADVEKMYRNIMLHEDQQHLQKILWRDSSRAPLQEMQLCTVTYGTKAAPYLAMRTLHQLAQDEGQMYPEAAIVLRNYFYMDDLVHGKDTVESAKRLIRELNELMSKGGFNLRKWASNEPSILTELSDEQKCVNKTINFNQEKSQEIKTLGLSWNPEKDNFTFNCTLPDSEKIPTKRTLLSDISRLYDPNGWLSPIIIKIKLLFQSVWVSNISWDENLPANIATEWEKLRKDLPNITKLSLRRWLCCNENEVEIHGFCDASEKAYACVIYSRTLNEKGEYVITLIAAKTKVAPLSKKVTLPRLELCGALLLAKLMEKVKSTITTKQLHIHCWTDSKVVLAWLQGNINRWEKYVANRVTQTVKIVSADQWQYVKSEENPADCATRGLLPSQLVNFNLWWEGPYWLKQANKQTKQKYTTETEVQASCCVTKNDDGNPIINALLNKCSTFKRVTRVTTYVLRFISALRDKQTKRSENLNAEEMKMATELLIKEVQHRHFGDEIEQLKKNGTVKSRSSILKLTPYLDEKGILRVKGRLENSSLSPETKHPIILPATARLTQLIIDDAHKQTLHGGARLTLAQTRQLYWIIGGNRTIKKQLRQCVRCQRFKPHKNEQVMADLPKARVVPSRPFSSTGVDFTGHVDVKINKGRGVKTCKAYIAIFICMVTKITD